MTSLDGFEEIYDLIRKKSNSTYAIQIKNSIKQDVESLDEITLQDFCKNIMHVNGNNKYRGLPILSLIDIQVLFSKMKKLDYVNQIVIIDAFEERYGKIYSNGYVDLKYKDDINGLLKLKSLYENSKDNLLFNPQACVDLEIAEKIGSLIDYFEKSVKKQEITKNS